MAMRGVVWRTGEVEVLRLWQDMMRFWPAPFAANPDDPPSELLAHGGVHR